MLPYEYKNVRICDIDGVLLKLRDIDHYFNEPAEPFEEAIKLVNKWFSEGDYILLWTARPEAYRQLTMSQLDQHGFKYHQLLMNKPHATKCMHIYDDANIVIHKIDREKGLEDTNSCTTKLAQGPIWDYHVLRSSNNTSVYDPPKDLLVNIFCLEKYSEIKNLPIIQQDIPPEFDKVFHENIEELLETSKPQNKEVNTYCLEDAPEELKEERRNSRITMCSDGYYGVDKERVDLDE